MFTFGDYAFYILFNLLLTTLMFPSTLKRRKSTPILSRRISASGILLFAAFVLYVIASSFRMIEPGIGGSDAWAYKAMFYEAEGSSLLAFIGRHTAFEPGFSLFSWTFYHIVPDYAFALFVWHSLSFILVYRFLTRFATRAHKMTSFLFVYAVNILLFEQYNTLRMSIAISVCLNALILFADGRRVWAVTLVILASSVHVSAAVILSVFLVYSIMENNSGMTSGKLIATVAASLVCSLMLIRVFLFLLSAIGKGVYDDGGAVSLGVYLPLFVLLILGCSRIRNIEEFKYGTILISALPVCLGLVPLQMSYSIVYRMTLYFLPVAYAFILMLIDAYGANQGCARKNAPSLELGYLMALILGNSYLLYRIISLFVEGAQHFGHFVLAF